MMNFGQRMLQLRKQTKLSREELGKVIGTSGAIVGRYERDEMKPSIEVAQRIADALDTTIDYLAGSGDVPLKDKKIYARIELLSQIDEEDRERILFVMDSLLRDAHQKRTQAQLAS